MELGESIAASAIREVWEETGIKAEITGLIGIYTNPRHVIEYTSDGEVRQECSVVFAARPTGGHVRTSDESSQVEWVSTDRLDEYTFHPSMRLRIDHYLERRPAPYIG